MKVSTPGFIEQINTIPANTRRSPKVGSMLAQRRRRWDNNEPTLGERFVFSGISKIRVILVQCSIWYWVLQKVIGQSEVESAEARPARIVKSPRLGQVSGSPLVLNPCPPSPRRGEVKCYLLTLIISGQGQQSARSRDPAMSKLDTILT